MSGDMTIQTRILRGMGNACLLIGELADQLCLTRSQVSQAAALLVSRGLIERLERGCFQVTPAGLAAVQSGLTIETGVTVGKRKLRTPRRAAIRQRAWSSMRIQRSFTIRDIAMVVAREADGDVEENLRRYFSELAKAGYLQRHARRQPGTAPSSNGFSVYTLARDTGPLAPVFSRQRHAIHDFNLGEDAPCAAI